MHIYVWSWKEKKLTGLIYFSLYLVLTFKNMNIFEINMETITFRPRFENKREFFLNICQS